MIVARLLKCPAQHDSSSTSAAAAGSWLEAPPPLSQASAAISYPRWLSHICRYRGVAVTVVLQPAGSSRTVLQSLLLPLAPQNQPHSSSSSSGLWFRSCRRSQGHIPQQLKPHHNSRSSSSGSSSCQIAYSTCRNFYITTSSSSRMKLQQDPALLPGFYTKPSKP
jgi:hypothetical protein